MRALPGCLALLTLASSALPQESTAPPGLVRVPGGTTYIGADWKDLAPLVLATEEIAMPMAAQTPQFQIAIDDFYLMVTEVTHEQYAAYVKATGAQPPVAWADKTHMNAERLRLLEEHGRKREEAKRAGQPLPPVYKFVDADWWKEAWQSAPWSVPTDQLAAPITWVDYQQASAYARWAGLRLMTEFEYQRACRGNSKRRYPWGEAFEGGEAAYLESPGDHPFPVGSFPAGATPEGIYDLAGNLWELTSSPFDPFPKWKAPEIEFGSGNTKRKQTISVPWDPNSRVAVGGSFQVSPVALACTTRRSVDRFSATEAMGFRCAASIEPGRDISTTVLGDDLPPELRPTGVNYALDRVTAIDHWTSERGSAQLRGEDKESSAAPGDAPAAQAGDLPNYAVITGYDYVLAIPADKPELGTTLPGMRTKSNEEGHLHLGVLSTTQAILAPALAAGTYLVAFRGAGEDAPAKPAEGEEEGEPVEATAAVAIEYPAGFDRAVDNLLFYGLDGKIVAALPNPVLEYTKDQAGSVAIRAATRTLATVDEQGEPASVEEPVDEAVFTLPIPLAAARKAWVLQLPLQFEKGRVEASWRTR